MLIASGYRENIIDWRIKLNEKIGETRRRNLLFWYEDYPVGIMEKIKTVFLLLSLYLA